MHQYGVTEYKFKLLHTEIKNEEHITHGGLIPKSGDTCKVTKEKRENKTDDGFKPLDIKKVSNEPKNVQEISDEKETTPEPIAQSRDDLVESLLKKTDELSDELIKAQMKLEDTLSTQEELIESIKSEAQEEAIIQAREEMKKVKESETNSALEQLNKSISKLDQQSEDFTTALKKINSELLTAALDIAKEVISIDVSEHSSKIAKKLIDELVNELQGASKIKLKINPQDFDKIKESTTELKNIELISDDAVALGGVIAMSDVGNIDAELHKRYERVKSAVLNN